MPICPIDNGFAYSLDVQQKIPLPLSRDMVSKSYMDRLIGSVVDAAAQDGVMLVTESEQGAEFLKPAMDWIQRSELWYTWLEQDWLRGQPFGGHWH